MEPKTEREFMLLMVEQIRVMREDIGELKNGQGGKASKTAVADLEGRCLTMEETLKAFLASRDLQIAREEAIKGAYEEAARMARQDSDDELVVQKLKNERARNWQILFSIVGGALVSATIIYFYLQK